METKNQKSQLEMENFYISLIHGHILDINTYCKRLLSNLSSRKNIPFSEEKNIKKEYLMFYIAMVKKHIEAIEEASGYLVVPKSDFDFSHFGINPILK